MAALEYKFTSVSEMAQAIAAYKKITKMTKFQQLERSLSKARHDEAQALTNARRQEKIETAKKALAKHLPIEVIQELTDLSRADIEALQ
ncbi:MAG: hypothetical protein LBR44_08790 [Clostridiales Family XIII bacterium]|jgi:predicted transposase/invertase (TIGR01784 family)|nr:hypothetical protein [Clostridiales Family XIII bacterium]